ncbi:hypothetical protein OGAPHI_001763 [Ogataea philodendri]|uniref:Transcription factor IIIC putative zinc-finger domain-containing protein n=1 Tax=Ogataea philodendri TaxID=1378263 RepID=A0A9P8PB37_9ASCO|nr:uncharacterized protein OGAPHI_001763 [Ogataea philodendri]KAH3668009.1 hypothetical protein OGAPHI_001763 [Ogataea philodendri]
MLDDLLLTRCQGASGDLIDWSSDGLISLGFRKELFILLPKQSREQSELSDVFTLTRLGGTISELPNALSELVCMDEQVLVGQVQDSSVASVVEARWSSSGVCEAKHCVLSLVTDTGNAFIFSQDGRNNWKCKFNIIDAQLSYEHIDLQRVIKYSQLKHLRIKSVGWFKPLKIDLLKAPIWPLTTNSTFVLCTESEDVWLYYLGETLTRLIKIELPNGSKVRKCKVSDWVETNGVSESYVVFELTTNELISQKIQFKDQFVLSDQFVVAPASRNLISQFTLATVDNYTYCTYSSAQLTTVQLQTQKVLQSPLHSVVSFTSIVHYGDTLLLSNSHDSVVIAELDWNSSTIQVHQFDYRQQVEYNHPLVYKLNAIRKQGPFRLMAMSLNPTSNNLALVHSERLQNTIDSRNLSSKEDYSLSIVPLEPPRTLQLSSIQYSPSYVQQLVSLGDNLAIPDPLDQELDRVTNAYTDLSAGLTDLFLLPHVQELRLANLSSPHKHDQKLLRQLAEIVLGSIKIEQLEANTSDALLYTSYLQLLDRKVPETNIVRLRIPGLNAEESFALGSKFDQSAIISEEGHTWARCSVTLLPLFTTKLCICENCGAKMASMETKYLGALTARILKFLELCPFCGGRWIRK